MINEIDNIDIRTECFNIMIQYDDFFALYKVRTDDTCLKYKQLALNIVCNLLINTDDRIILNLIKFCYSEINILYNMGARPTPYTIGIICSNNDRCIEDIANTLITFCKKILTKYNNVFQPSMDTRIMKILRNNKDDNILVNIVEYNPDNGMFDDTEINMYLYLKIFRYEYRKDKDIKKSNDELDILIEEIENCG
jgi:hypothetical protein